MDNDEHRPKRSIEELRDLSRKLSRQILEMTTAAGSGHPSSSLSAIDVLTALYFGGVLRYDPARPQWPARDRFILSKGHGVPALYAVMAEAGYFDPEKLMTLRELGSPLEGHPNMRALPGLEASTGSLGQGLSIGLGHALAARIDDLDYRVYVMLGDGEADEGQVWEATMAATKYNVHNLTAILDYNQFQQTGPVSEVMPSLVPFADKWAVFGWRVLEIDGHDIDAILDALAQVQEEKDRPQIIVARTKKGKGLDVFEEDRVNRMHGEPVEEDELDEVLAELAR
ncbi:MAG: transketolase [Chloroflexota bacterium]